MDTVHVRNFVNKDRPALRVLARELQATQVALYDRMKPPGEIGDDYIEYLLAECAKSKGTILVAADEDTLVGYAVILTAVSSEDEVDEANYLYAYVQDLVVTQRYHGRGVASQLLSRCEELARDAGVHWLRVTALAENADALRVYKKAGFGNLFTVLEKPIPK